MSNSTSLLDTISVSQAGKETTANAMFDAASQSMIFGRRASTTSALTFGYYGGRFTKGDGTNIAVANGTIALSASLTNYIEVDTAGAVTKNTSAFTAGRIPLYTVVTGASTITSYTDHRNGSQGNFLSAVAAGSVTTVSVVTANGVSGSVATATTTPAITLTLGAITPTTVTPSGLVDISGASAGQIKFPASQNASGDANTLDDYEEGTWTPGVAFGGASVGVTYSSQIGLYTKIGNVVNYSGLFALSSKGSSTGGMTVTGLPFTTNGTSGYRASASPLGFDFAAAYTTSMQVDLTNSSTSMRVFKFAAGNASQITDTDAQNNSQMEVNGLYHV